MANPEHLAILQDALARNDIAIWNNWRQQNPLIRPDLSGSRLQGRNLRFADLHGATLTKSQWNLVDLRNANLSEANLGESDLSGARLTDADLRGAVLWMAELVDADLTRASLQEADFTYATIGYTILAGVHLDSVRGLERVKHRGYSYIDINTVYFSKGAIPQTFLALCGFPEKAIGFVQSVGTSPIPFYSAFISYSSRDQDFAEQLYSNLKGEGVRVWFAPEDLKIGDMFRSRIDEAIRIYDKLIVVLSENSINSAWVRREVKAALEKEKQQNRTVLFPIRLDDAVMSSTEQWADDIRRDRHIGDFTKWKNHDDYQKAFERLLRDLQADSQPPNA